MTSVVRPYGSWQSPIDIELLTRGSVGISEVQVDPGDGSLYWLESRAAEQGRIVLVRRQDGEVRDVTPAPFSVRNSVHEYGGGSYRVRDGWVVFSNFTDGRVYLTRADGADGAESPRAITRDLPDRVLRYADLELDLPRRRVIAVREDHRGVGESDGPAECVNTIVSIDIDTASPHEGEILVDGHDFVSSPRLSPDGHRLLWLTWEHPNMPWDSTTLWSGDADAQDVRQLAGGDGISIAEVGWTPDGRPVWSSDVSGFWNVTVDGRTIYQPEAECAGPAWVFGDPAWCVLDDDAMVVGRHDRGALTLVRLRRGDEPRDLVSFSGGSSPVADGDHLVMVASFPDRPAALVRVDGNTGEYQVLKNTVELDVDPAGISVAQPVEWPSTDGATSFGYLYPPASAHTTGPDDERPPLVVLSHGGPSAATGSGLSLSIQFWTSRGFAVLDVDYGGSTGYGRRYRERLNGNWGIVDVDDCCSGAAFLADQDRVDRHRMVIKGGSAGGYTTLAALAFRDTFAVGVSKYGIGDLEMLATDTHKFESRYLDGLVGAYPQDRETYLERSPLHHLDGLDCALLILQGQDDKVVPPNQALAMADAVRDKGKPVLLRLYPGEGHGFRGAETIVDATLTELGFYGRVFGFTPDDAVPELVIDNLLA